MGSITLKIQELSGNTVAQVFALGREMNLIPPNTPINVPVEGTHPWLSLSFSKGTPTQPEKKKKKIKKKKRRTPNSTTATSKNDETNRNERTTRARAKRAQEAQAEEGASDSSQNSVLKSHNQY